MSCIPDTCPTHPSSAAAQIVVSGILEHPFDLAVFGDYIFWTDWVDLAVGRAEKRTGRHATFLLKDRAKPMGIVAVSREATACESAARRRQAWAGTGAGTFLCVPALSFAV